LVKVCAGLKAEPGFQLLTMPIFHSAKSGLCLDQVRDHFSIDLFWARHQSLSPGIDPFEVE
jgi:hypothetical protein